MTRIMVWDIPTRLFHWLLAAAFFAAFGIAQFVDDENPSFSVHMLLGIVIGFMVILRIIWGFVGSKYARFSSFLFSPRDLFVYIKSVFAGDGKRYVGHNPGAGYTIFAMLVMLIGLVATGLLMQNNNELLEELHGFLAYATIAAVFVHLSGMVLHTVKHRENIIFSMVSGTKEGEQNEGIPSFRYGAGIVFLLLTGFWAVSLFNSYNPDARQATLPIIGKTIQLGESEDEAEENEDDNRYREDDDDGKPYR
jgi:cytochrome b